MDLTNLSSIQHSWKLEVNGEPVILENPAQVMAILNVTPDSFSDGGEHADPESAVAYAQSAISDGATIIDVGGESTRPGSQSVSAEEELQRVLPVIEAIRGLDVFISIDTSKALVAERALQAGAHIVNDVSAGLDPKMFEVVARHGAAMVLMHMQGTPATMQDKPSYENVVEDVMVFFRQRIQLAEQSGVSTERLILDPGIGFGKTLEQNISLLKHLDKFHQEFNRPLLVGLSRKSYLPNFFNRNMSADQRDAWSHYFHTHIANACEIIRVHDVLGAMEARSVAAIFRESSNV